MGHELMELLIRNGCQVKTGKVYSLRAPGFTRFARLDTLSPGYQPKDLLGVFSGKRKHVTRQSRREKTLVQEQRISLVIDIQRIIREKKGAGYERWAKTYNLKQMAKALNYLTTHQFSDYEKLKNSAKSLMEKRDRLAGKLNHVNQEIERNEKWKKAIVAYAQTRGVFTEYKKARYSRSFYLEHQEEIERYREAAEIFRELSGGEKPPKIDQLKEEGRKLYQQRKKLRADYDQVKDEAREVLAVKENIDCLLGYSGSEKEQEKKNSTRKEDIKSER